jgi:hypothetical protein
MQSAYQAGRHSAGAELIDINSVWADGIGALERQPDGVWLCTAPDKHT